MIMNDLAKVFNSGLKYYDEANKNEIPTPF